jgi:cytochrome c2
MAPRLLAFGSLLVILAAAATACANRDGQVRRWTGGDPYRGKEGARRYGCSSCHSIPGVRGADGLVGPPLDHIASRAYVAGRLPNNPENLMRFIAHPHGVERETAMPEMGIPDQDVRDIAAYLYTLK